MQVFLQDMIQYKCLCEETEEDVDEEELENVFEANVASTSSDSKSGADEDEEEDAGDKKRSKSKKPKAKKKAKSPKKAKAKTKAKAKAKSKGKDTKKARLQCTASQHIWLRIPLRSGKFDARRGAAGESSAGSQGAKKQSEEGGLAQLVFPRYNY